MIMVKTWAHMTSALFETNRTVAPVNRRVQNRATSSPNVMRHSYTNSTTSVCQHLNTPAYRRCQDQLTCPGDGAVVVGEA